MNKQDIYKEITVWMLDLKCSSNQGNNEMDQKDLHITFVKTVWTKKFDLNCSNIFLLFEDSSSQQFSQLQKAEMMIKFKFSLPETLQTTSKEPKNLDLSLVYQKLKREFNLNAESLKLN